MYRPQAPTPFGLCSLPPCSLTDLPPSLCLHPSPTRNTLLAGLVSWVGWEEDSPHDGPLWTLVSPHSGTGTCD